LTGDLPERSHVISWVELPEVLLAEKVLGERLDGQEALNGCIKEAYVVGVFKTHKTKH